MPIPPPLLFANSSTADETAVEGEEKGEEEEDMW